MTRLAGAILIATLLVAPAADGQWLTQPTVGIPRDTNGKPRLDAPAPRLSDGTPDLSGLWAQPLSPGYLANITSDVPASSVSPAAAKAFEERTKDFGKDDPGTIGCLPLGPREIIGGGTATIVKIVQSPTLIVMLYEDLAYRQIHLDGRTLPRDPNPSFMGYSVGHWDGSTLVVESTGFNDRTWLDFGGHPHTERLRTTERFTRQNFGRIDRELTLSDDELYRQPITLHTSMTLRPDTELLEYVCAENQRITPHLVGRTQTERLVVVPPDTLEKYVGTYEGVGSNDLGITQLTITRSGGELYIDLNGKGHVLMVPLSPTMFSPRLLGTYEFVSDGSGRVTHVLAHAAEGTFRFNRRP